MHILFADDSRAVSLPIIAFLEQEGHRVTYARNGAEALERFMADPPDLILMDVVMPEMDGMEATRRIKALGSERWIPLIMMTGLEAKEDLVRGMEAGADDYLTKPIVPEILAARIGSMQRIAQIQSRLFGILDNVYEGIITIDGKGTISTFNKGAERIFGYAPEETIGRNVMMLMPAPYHEEHDGYLARYQREGTPRVIGIGRKVRGLRKNGETFAMRLAVTEVQYASERQFVGLVQDISVEEEAQQKVEYLAKHDALTGLPNRAQFNDALAQACQAAPQQPSAVLFIDLDGFKPINDGYGHEAGDQALITVARRLRHTIKEGDFVARLGGDEFVAIFTGVSLPEQAMAVGQRILDAITPPMDLLGHTCKLGASIGAALMPSQGTAPTEVLILADHAMYAAKRAGKGRVTLAEKDVI